MGLWDFYDQRPTQPAWFVNDVPGEFLVPFEFHQSRGPDPATFEFFCSDDRFEGLENPVSITFVAPNNDNLQQSVVTFENWWIVGSRKTNKGLTGYTLADIRWKLKKGSISRDYNVIGADGEYRDGSRPSGSESWTVLGAAKDALELLVSNVEDDDGRTLMERPAVLIRTETSEIVDKTLPDNLGNSSAGGFVAANLRTIVEQLLGESGDIVPTRDGRLAIVDRHEPVNIDFFHQYGQLDGEVGERSNRWARHKTVRIRFPKRIGSTMIITVPDGSGEVTTIPDGGRDDNRIRIVAENVVPDPADRPDAVTEPEDQKYVTFTEFYGNGDVMAYNITDATLRKYLFEKEIVELSDDDGNPRYARSTLLRAIQLERNAREHWRRTFRVEPDFGRRRYVDIQLGTLQLDGTTAPPFVRMDYAEVRRWPAGSYGEMTFNLTSTKYESPFVAAWMVYQQDLIFRLIEQPTPASVASVVPGHIAEETMCKLALDKESGDPVTGEDLPLSTLNLCQVKPGPWTIEVDWHGHYVGETDRTYDVDLELYPDAESGVIDVLADGVDALFRDFSFDGDPFGGKEDLVIINHDAVTERAEWIRDHVKLSYEQDRFGMCTFNGVQVLSEGGFEPRGDLFDVSIHVGSRDAWTIDTVLDVRPEFRLPLRQPQVPIKAKAIR